MNEREIWPGQDDATGQWPASGPTWHGGSIPDPTYPYAPSAGAYGTGQAGPGEGIYGGQGSHGEHGGGYAGTSGYGPGSYPQHPAVPPLPGQPGFGYPPSGPQPGQYGPTRRVLRRRR
jgi:hypothetical protein